MVRAVSVGYFTAVTARHPGGNYFGTGELQASSDGSSWTTIASLSGSGSCTALRTSVTDHTAYPYFRFSMHGNGRSTYHHFHSLDIRVASATPFDSLVAWYEFSNSAIEGRGPNNEDCNSTSCAEIWDTTCGAARGGAREFSFGDTGNSNGDNFIVFTMSAKLRLDPTMSVLMPARSLPLSLACQR